MNDSHLRTQRWISLTLALAAAWLCGPAATAQPAGDEPIALNEALVIEPVGVAQRSPIHTDAIEKMIVEGSWTPPRAGGKVRKPDGGEATWAKQQADAAGWIIHQGYISWTVQLDADAIMMLDASGHSLVYVNGLMRTGDPYQYGNLSLPVSLHAGENELLFYCSRGRMRASLSTPKGEVFFDLRDATLPDVLRGDARRSLEGGVVLVNATNQSWAGDIALAQGSVVSHQAIGTIAPLSMRKVAVAFDAPDLPASAEKIEYTMRAIHQRDRGAGYSAVEPAMVSLNVRNAGEHHLRTFTSDIDGSVQMYSVQPSSTPGEGQALFLTLHGAGVHAPSQSGSYAAKDWGTVVAPTNRRQFGFDWEDWGRLDAMEVLDEAVRIFRPDPDRVYLTGHSMGGHGTWQVGAQFPNRFAAIGPSAGWVSFWSYTGASEFDAADPIGAIMARAALPSDTLALSPNYRQLGVYVLHGDADDNVPVEQARQMRSHLASYHADFAYYERAGAGHWWGSPCVDWPPMFDFFRNHVRTSPQHVRHVQFITANPSISSRSQWVIIEQQERSLIASSVDVNLVLGSRHITGSTVNVRRIAFDVPLLREAFGESEETTSVVISLDGSDIECDLAASEDGLIHLVREDGGWARCRGPQAEEKRIGRSGPFKDAFRNRMVFVYGTRGSGAEALWNLSKARCDAETWFYRGNGSVDVISDVEYNLGAFGGRNVILYGNADTNLAWSKVLADSPIQVRRDELTCGDRTLKGDDLACVFTYPNSEDQDSLVAAVSGTGLPGGRLTDRFTYFVSGVHYPDWYIASPEVLTDGIGGVIGAGFFDQQWQVDPAQSAWRE
ncbi:MAG: prolyl oligopeptidase family serine peptidase [Phycisphaerales bacterium]|nr:prolyl oligopeptidase family serine peptidase [Phycisphaerales bacterium]